MNHRGSTFALCVALSAALLAPVDSARGQTAAEHASHHPAADGAGTPMPAPVRGDTNPAAAQGMPNPAPAPGAMSGGQAAGAGGGMGAGMGEMMKQMGTPPRKEFYPTLMALPEGVMTSEQRAGIELLALEQLNAGIALLSSAITRLSDATSDQDLAGMEQATAQMRDGLAQFEAGVAARRLLSEGTATRNLALGWFKREMNLASPVRPAEPRTFLGVTPFHLFTMVLLAGFSLAMVCMYFFKMRRAAALFRRLEPDQSAAPPGSSPPLSGASGPPTPPSGPVPAPAPTDRSVARTSAPAATPPPGSSISPSPRGDAARAAG